MKIIALPTRVFYPPRDDIREELIRAAEQAEDRSVVAVTSKAVSIQEGRCVPLDHFTSRDELAKQEADYYLPRERTPGEFALHTLKDGRWCGSAGVDKSNANGFYILLPCDVWYSAENILKFLQYQQPHKTLAVIITDSVSQPLYRGIRGAALSFAGLDPLFSYGGRQDLFGRVIRWGRVNVADALASAAVWVMGEGGDAQPLALISDLPPELFMPENYDPSLPFSSFQVPPEEDLYRPFLESVEWLPGGGGYRTEWQAETAWE